MEEFVPHARRLLVRIFLVVVLGLLSMGCRDSGSTSLTEQDDPLLSEFQARNKSRLLRALIFRPSPGQIDVEGDQILEDKNRVMLLATALNMVPEFVEVAKWEEMEEALDAGAADLIATLRRPRREEPHLFSTPVRYAHLVVAVENDQASNLTEPKHLVGKQICMTTRASELFDPQRLQELAFQPLEISVLGGNQDYVDVLDRVGHNCQAAVVAKQQLQRYNTRYRELKLAFVLKRRIPLAWTVQKGNERLLDTINGQLFQQALSKHRQYQYVGSLKEIRKRKVLRVALLNNAMAYFIYRGQEVGFQYEIVELLAKRLGARLEIVVPKNPDQLNQFVLDGKADVALVTPSADKAIASGLAYSSALMRADQVLVQAIEQEALLNPAQLAQQTVYVRERSQYFKTLTHLGWVPGFRIKKAPKHLETEDLIDLVGRGTIPFTVSNSALLQVEMTYRNDIYGSLVLAEGIPLVFAVRAGSKHLMRRIEIFLQQDCQGGFFHNLKRKYFVANKRMAAVRSVALSNSGSISPYDSLVKRYGRKYGLDWRLVSAQIYQESRFDPKAKSWAGARGLMQVMPKTAAELGIVDLWDPEKNVQAGMQYLSSLLNRFDQSILPRQRIRFALAAYNAGFGHVQDARRLAKLSGLDPNRWFGQVEKAIILLEKPEYNKNTRYGYCRGSEPVQYVSRIQSKYDAYASLRSAD